MSSVQGIAAVSRGLASFFQTEFRRESGESDAGVSVEFPNANNGKTILFLYKTEVDSGYRSHIPDYEAIATKAPLPLRLHYILVFNHESQSKAQIRLAQALRVLQRTPILPKEYAEQEQNVRLIDQHDPIRLAHDNLSLEDLTKLWTSFQLRYRLTMPFTASVLMLDVEPKPEDPKPILERPIPGKTLVVQPNLGTRILSAFGQLDDDPSSLTKRSSIPVGSYLVLEVSGDIHSIKALEFSFVEQLKDGSVKPTPFVISEGLEKFGNRLRLRLPGNQSWIAGVYQVKAVMHDPFASHANSGSDHKSNAMLLKIAPTMGEQENGKFGQIQVIPGDRPRLILKSIFKTKPNVKTRQENSTDPPINALFTQIGLEQGNTSPKSFEIPFHRLDDREVEFRTRDDNEQAFGIEAGEKYVLRIRVGDAVSNHYAQDRTTTNFDPRAVFAFQEEVLTLDVEPKPAIEPIPEDPIPEEPISEDPVPEEPISEDPVPEEPIPEESIPEEPISEEPIPEEPIPEEPIPEEPISEEPIPEEPGVRIVSAFGQLDDDPTSSSKQSSIPVGSYLVLEISGDPQSVKALEFSFAEQLKDGSVGPEPFVISNGIDKFGNRLRLKLPENQDWIAGNYQVKAIMSDPFLFDAKSNSDLTSNAMLIKIALTLSERANGKFGDIRIKPGDQPKWFLTSTFKTRPNMVIKKKKPKQIPEISTEPPIFAVFTQVSEQGNSSPKSFEIPIHRIRGNEVEFWTHNIDEKLIRVEAGEQYVLQIRVGDLVSNHYAGDGATTTFDPRAIFNLQEEIENGN